MATYTLRACLHFIPLPFKFIRMQVFDTQIDHIYCNRLTMFEHMMVQLAVSGNGLYQ